MHMSGLMSSSPSVFMKTNNYIHRINSPQTHAIPLKRVYHKPHNGLIGQVKKRNAHTHYSTLSMSAHP